LIHCKSLCGGLEKMGEERMSEESRKAIAKLMFGKKAEIVADIFPILLGIWGVSPPSPPPVPRKGESKDERKR
jgi:hypothetical protein